MVLVASAVAVAVASEMSLSLRGKSKVGLEHRVSLLVALKLVVSGRQALEWAKICSVA